MQIISLSIYLVSISRHNNEEIMVQLLLGTINNKKIRHGPLPQYILE